MPSALLKRSATFALLVGLVIAFFGIYLSAKLNAPWIDGASSVLIGMLLCLVALVMVYESKGLLVGEGVDRQMLDSLRALVETDPDVEHVQHLHTIYQGPREVSLVIELRFCGSISALDIRTAISRLKSNIQERHPEIRRVFFGAESITEEGSREEASEYSEA